MRRAMGALLGLILSLNVMAQASDKAYTLTCDPARGRLLVPVTINGTPGFTALLDAGLLAPVVSHQALATLRIAGDATGSVALTGFELSAKVRHEGNAAAGDLAALSETLGTTIDAIAPLHQPGLEVTVDVAQGRVTYRPLNEALLGATGDGTVPLRLREGGVPVVQVLIDGKHQRELALDLAYPGVACLSEETLMAIGLLQKDPPALRTLNADGRATVQFRLPTLRVGNTEIEAPIGEMAPGADRLGLGALQHFEVTLNYEAGLIRWRANAGPTVPAQPLVGYGLALARLRAGQWELGVAEGSPAAEAGILPGAILAGIGNTPLRKTDHATTGRLLRAVPGQELLLTVVQAGSPLELLLTARELL